MVHDLSICGPSRTAPVYEAIEGIVNIPASDNGADDDGLLDYNTTTYHTAGNSGLQVWKFSDSVTSDSASRRRGKRKSGDTKAVSSEHGQGSTSFQSGSSGAPKATGARTHLANVAVNDGGWFSTMETFFEPWHPRQAADRNHLCYCQCRPTLF